MTPVTYASPYAKIDRNAAMFASYKAGMTFKEVAAAFGVSRTSARKIVHRFDGAPAPHVPRAAPPIVDDVQQVQSYRHTVAIGSVRLLSALWTQHPGIVAHLTKRAAA